MIPIQDNVSSLHNGSSGNSLSWNHVLGTLRKTGLIVVGAVGEDTSGGSLNQIITGVTFNGVAMTRVQGEGNNSAHSIDVVLYELHGSAIPAPGTYLVVVEYSSNNEARAGICMSFKNIYNQNYESQNGNSGNGVTPISSILTTTYKNALIIAVHGNQNDNTVAWSTGETINRPSLTGGEIVGLLMGYKIVPTPNSYTSTANPGNPEAEGLIVASFRPAKSKTGALLLSLL